MRSRSYRGKKTGEEVGARAGAEIWKMGNEPEPKSGNGKWPEAEAGDGSGAEVWKMENDPEPESKSRRWKMSWSRSRSLEDGKRTGAGAEMWRPCGVEMRMKKMDVAKVKKAQIKTKNKNL